MTESRNSGTQCFVSVFRNAAQRSLSVTGRGDAGYCISSNFHLTLWDKAELGLVNPYPGLMFMIYLDKKPATEGFGLSVDGIKSRMWLVQAQTCGSQKQQLNLWQNIMIYMSKFSLDASKCQVVCYYLIVFQVVATNQNCIYSWGVFALLLGRLVAQLWSGNNLKIQICDWLSFKLFCSLYLNRLE